MLGPMRGAIWRSHQSHQSHRGQPAVTAVPDPGVEDPDETPTPGRAPGGSGPKASGFDLEIVGVVDEAWLLWVARGVAETLLEIDQFRVLHTQRRALEAYRSRRETGR